MEVRVVNYGPYLSTHCNALHEAQERHQHGCCDANHGVCWQASNEEGGQRDHQHTDQQGQSPARSVTCKAAKQVQQTLKYRDVFDYLKATV
jgi:hypothetical protein